MPNRSYLCGSRQPRLHPSYWDEAFDPDTQILVNDVIGVPALWFALFRPDDVVSQVFETDEGHFHVEAPIASTEKALAQLRSAGGVLEQAFAGLGSAAGYLLLFEQAIAASPWPYVTIEMTEIAYAGDPAAFYADVRRLLEKMEQQTADGMLELLSDLSAFEALTVLPPARYCLDALEDVTENDAWNHCRMIGAGQLHSGIGRAVPWEPEGE